MKSRFPENPSRSHLVITNLTTGHRFVKYIKGSAKTVMLVTQHWARSPNHFVYRVNCYPRIQP